MLPPGHCSVALGFKDKDTDFNNHMTLFTSKNSGNEVIIQDDGILERVS